MNGTNLMRIDEIKANLHLHYLGIIKTNRMKPFYILMYNCAKEAKSKNLSPITVSF